MCVYYLNLEKSLPNMVCTGIRNMRTTMPAKHDGPISAHSSPTTAAAWRGPTHKKWRKIVTCWREHTMNELEHYQKSKQQQDKTTFDTSESHCDHRDPSLFWGSVCTHPQNSVMGHFYRKGRLTRQLLSKDFNPKQHDSMTWCNKKPIAKKQNALKKLWSSHSRLWPTD